jgi:hypothetical protein
MGDCFTWNPLYKIKIKFSLNNEIIKTDITFNNYIHLFKNNYDPSNIDKLNKALSKPETKRNLRSRTKTKNLLFLFFVFFFTLKFQFK